MNTSWRRLAPMVLGLLVSMLSGCPEPEETSNVVMSGPLGSSPPPSGSQAKGAIDTNVPTSTPQVTPTPTPTPTWAPVSPPHTVTAPTPSQTPQPLPSDPIGQSGL